jgi:putative hydroxymethylpyrimidine transport system ATP-binding protein
LCEYRLENNLNKSQIIPLPAGLSLRGVSFSYGAEFAFENLNLDIGVAEFVSIIGPSGCGKTTLLNIISGLIDPSDGKIYINGKESSRLGQISYMHQEDTLLPWRTAFENAILGLEINGELNAKSRQKVMTLFEDFGLLHTIKKMPSTLSGGMKQRVSFLRSMLTNNQVLLLDEPFASLDAITRIEIRGWLKSILYNHSRTVLLVTHDIEEAIALSNRIIVINGKTNPIFSEIVVGDSVKNHNDIFNKEYVILYKKILSLINKE